MNDFPYIKQIKVNDCYTYKDFKVFDKPTKDFKHIILTGKNGSGKTTILNRIGFLLQQIQNGNDIEAQIRGLNQNISNNPKSPKAARWKEQLKTYHDVELEFHETSNQLIEGLPLKYYKENRGEYVISFFRAHRKVDLEEVSTVTKESDFLQQLNQSQDSEHFIKKFKQYIVNKKVYEAFDYMNAKTDSLNQNQVFFDKLTDTLRIIFKDKSLELEFVQENFEFYLNLADGRKVTFNQLSEGFSAFLSILMDLILRTDLIRKENNDYSFDPSGIVLIDEPETHFHLEMQYEILPLITSLFPNIQLVIATHSPAIISSLEAAYIFDLSSKNNSDDRVQGSSFSELMIKHFGLENEFSPKVDRLLDELKQAYKSGDSEVIKKLLEKYEDILTPSLRLEIETRAIEINSRKKND